MLFLNELLHVVRRGIYYPIVKVLTHGTIRYLNAKIIGWNMRNKPFWKHTYILHSLLLIVVIQFQMLLPFAKN